MRTLLKKIYGYIPFKRELFLLLRIVWKPERTIYQHLHFVGVFRVKLDHAKTFKVKHYGFQIENEIFWAGLQEGWEKDSMKLWIKLCEESKIIFDVGANTGIYSLVAKTINPKSKVYAFEPVDRVFIKLEENIALNNFDIIPIKKALSNTDGFAKIYDIESEHIYSVTVNKNMNSPETKVRETTIETITLDTFIKINTIPKIDLIKIDVETHEPEVLEGFSQHIKLFKPTLLIEILNDEVGEKVERMVNGLGYLFFNINEQGKIKKVSKIVKSDYYNYLICSQNIANSLGI